MTKKCIGWVVVLGFLCGAVAQAQAVADLSQFLGNAASCQKSVGPESGTGGGSSTQGFCQATCWNGNNVSVSCSPCGAVDSSCVDHVNGGVTCNGSFAAQCAACPVSCDTTNGTACSGSSQISCYTSDNWIGYCSCFRSVWTCTL
jgi:hypothetical protein